MLALAALFAGVVAGIVAYTSVFKAWPSPRRVVGAVVVGIATPVLLFVLLAALVAMSFLVESRR